MRTQRTTTMAERRLTCAGGEAKQQKAPSRLACGASACQRGQTPLRARERRSRMSCPCLSAHMPRHSHSMAQVDRGVSHESLWPTDPRSGSGNCLGRLGVLTPRQRRLPEADAVASRRPCHPMACCAKPLGMRGALPALVALRLGVRAKACAPAHSGTAALGGSATPAAGEGTPGHILKIHWKMAARPLEPAQTSFDKISIRNLFENGRPAAGAGPGQFW